MTEADARAKSRPMPAALVLELSESQGRVELCMTVQRLGGDYTVSLFGGEAHVGAVALAVPRALTPAAAQSGDTVGESPSTGSTGSTGDTGDTGGENISTSVLVVPAHREDELACKVAHTLAAALGCRVCVVCGIHYARITREEIAQVMLLADRLAQRALHDLGCCRPPVIPSARHPVIP